MNKRQKKKLRLKRLIRYCVDEGTFKSGLSISKKKRLVSMLLTECITRCNTAFYEHFIWGSPSSKPVGTFSI